VHWASGDSEADVRGDASLLVRPRATGVLPGLVAAVVLVTVGSGRAPSAEAQDPGDSARVAQFLDGVRGTPPLSCDLAGQVLDNRFGWASVEPVLHVLRASGAAPSIDPFPGGWARRTLSGSGVVTLLRAGVGDADPCVRHLAARLFGHIETGDAVDALRSGLADRSAATREATALALGFTRHARGTGLLIEALADSVAPVRAAVVWALGRIGHPSVVRPLVGRLGDREPIVRASAAWALGEMERIEAVSPLADALDDRDPAVRRNAAWGLGKIGHPSAADALMTALREDRDVNVRRTAAWALGNLN
jgi:hypothetical protein